MASASAPTAPTARRHRRQQPPGGPVELRDLRQHLQVAPAAAGQAHAQAGRAAPARVAHAAAGAADRHAHLRGLRRHPELAEKPGEQRVRPLVVDDEAGVDGHLPPAGRVGQVRVGVAAEPAVGLEEGHLVGPRQDVARREPADAAADDGDSASGHGHPSLPVSVTSYVCIRSPGAIRIGGVRDRRGFPAGGAGLAGYVGTCRGQGAAAEDVPQRAVQVRVPERVAQRGQHARPDPLARLRELPGPLVAEQQPRRHRGHRDQRGPAEHPAEGPRVLRVPRLLRRDRVDRPGQGRVGDGAQVDVEQVVDLDPGQPPPAVPDGAAQAGLEDRVQQAQHPAARGLHDAGADLDGPDPRRRGRSGRVLPGGGHVGQEPVAAAALLGQDLVAAVGAVEAHRGRGDEGPQPAAGPGGQRGQRAGRADPAGQDLPLALRGEAAADRGAREVDHRVDAGQQVRVGVVRPPLPLAVIARRMPDQPDHPVAAGGEQRRQGRADRPARPGERDRQRLGAQPPGPRVRGQVRRELPVPVAEHRPQRPGRDRRGDDVDRPWCPRARART